MKNQRDRLHQYQRRITVLTDKETDIAKQMLAKGDKKRALLALRRKKYQESLLAKTDAQLAQLEKLTNDVEFALIQKDVVFGLQQGTKVLKEIHAEMGGIENVEKLMGETADAIAYQQVRCYDRGLLLTALCSQTHRKSAICLEVVSPTMTSKRWKTNWKPSKPHSQHQLKVYPPFLKLGYQRVSANNRSKRGSREKGSPLC
jgi:charged multivesicular body protein 6